MHACPTCGYSFPAATDLDRHESEGRGCPEAERNR